MVTSGRKWDQRWKERVAQPLEPDSWLQRIEPLLPRGKVLDIACGRGRNALYLAQRGFSVTAVDLSEEALDQLRKEAVNRGLAIQTRLQDLESAVDLPDGPFDTVLCFFYLQRSLLPALRAAVRPGGVAVVRTFSRAGDFPGEIRVPEFALDAGELLWFFDGWDILLHEEGLEPSNKGGGLAGIVARKPVY